MSTRETLLEFPCDFPIKVFGKDDGGFQARVFDLVAPHVTDLKRSDMSAKPSSGGKYLAVTVNIVATSQDQIDAIYSDLTGNQQVLMAL